MVNPTIHQRRGGAPRQLEHLTFLAQASAPGNVPSLGTVEVTFTCTGVVAGSPVSWSVDTTLLAGTFVAYVKCAAANTIVVGYGNDTAAPADPGNHNISFAVAQQPA